MQAAIRTVGGELAQAAAEGMMSVELKRAEAEIARLSVELTEARGALAEYGTLEIEAEGLRRENGRLREENGRLKTEVELLRYRESRDVGEKLERLNELSRQKRPAPLWVRIWAGGWLAINMIFGEKKCAPPHKRRTRRTQRKTT